MFSPRDKLHEINISPTNSAFMLLGNERIHYKVSSRFSGSINFNVNITWGLAGPLSGIHDEPVKFEIKQRWHSSSVNSRHSLSSGDIVPVDKPRKVTVTLAHAWVSGSFCSITEWHGVSVECYRIHEVQWTMLRLTKAQAVGLNIITETKITVASWIDVASFFIRLFATRRWFIPTSHKVSDQLTLVQYLFFL